MSNALATKYPENSLLAREIARQPELWLDTQDRVLTFLQDATFPDGPVVITGAGTSAYAGQAIAAAWPGAICIPTTDLILMSEAEINMASPGLVDGGLVISLARSGDSPESAGVVNRLQKLFPKTQQMAITCNADGQLARMPGVKVLVLSPDTNDRSLAMTSSFSNLTLAGLLLKNSAQIAPHLPSIVAQTKAALQSMYATAVEIAAITSSRSVVLTSSMHGLATEASLKLLELTAGDRLAMPEGFLAFRHGPISALREQTPVICFTSTDPAKLAYEEDFVRDLQARSIGRVALVGNSSVADWPCDWFIPSAAPMLPDYLRTPFEVVFAQLFAYASSIQVGVDPDDPSPNGEVTRVVKPFEIRV